MYTQGPLDIKGPSNGKQKSIDGGGDFAILKDGFIVGEAFRLCGELPSKVPVIADAESNARLWASAPDLLADCKALLEAFEGYEMLAALAIDVQEKARRDIAKAEG